jgi:hypothetical protein
LARSMIADRCTKADPSTPLRSGRDDTSSVGQGSSYQHKRQIDPSTPLRLGRDDRLFVGNFRNRTLV